MKNDIEALRGFANEVFSWSNEIWGSDVNKALLDFGLIDKDGNKTEILTGSKDTIKDRQRKENFAIIKDILNSGLEEFRGWAKEDLHLYLKEAYLVPIFLEDDSEFREHWDAIQSLGSNVSVPIRYAVNIKKTYLNHVSIMDCDKDQAERYLREIKQFCFEHGVRLSAPKYYEGY